MSKEVTVREKKDIRHYNIEKIADMTGMANVLKTYIVKQGLFSNIQGKNYAHVEGWQFAGGMMNLYPKVIKVENLSNDKEIKWRADVEIVDMKTGKVVANGFAVCSNKEANKTKNEEYAILSMAQTRAIGKAYRNLIGWVMKLAGYESTPSEEMTIDIGKKGKDTTVPPKPQNLKSQIMFLLKELGVDPTSDLNKEIKKLTKLDPKDEKNLPEIKSRLEIILEESKL